MLKILKPSASKVIMTILVVIITFFVFQFGFGCGFDTSPPFVCIGIVPLLNFLLFPMIVIDYSNSYFLITALIVTTVVWHYLISTTIVSLYKIRKKECTLEALLPLLIIMLAVCIVLAIMM